MLVALGGASSSGAPRPAVLDNWCQAVRGAIQKFKWQADPCEGIDWKIGGMSVEGRPLVYAEFGDPNAKNTTLVFTMVHGDEVTPLYLGVQLAHWMAKRMEEENSRKGIHMPVRVVIAPLVNPDGFFRKTRTNARKVDLNRNLATRDWQANALRLWKTKFGSARRRFPGHSAASEPETIFQQELIQSIKPHKILSVHAPLNFMDYDGPTRLSLDRFPQEYVKECLKLRTRLKAVSGGFFPGSLGNYSGQELGIPTLTLELPTADPRKAEQYWNKFQTGIRTMIEFNMPQLAARPQEHAGN
jgi:protein MpaA